MLVAGLLGMLLAGLFGLILEFVYYGIDFCSYYLRYMFVPSFRAEQKALKKAKCKAERIQKERIAKYGNDDSVQYGDSRCAGLGCTGCHCNWDGTDRPPCY